MLVAPRNLAEAQKVEVSRVPSPVEPAGERPRSGGLLSLGFSNMALSEARLRDMSAVERG
jgi:hypothetical protein